MRRTFFALLALILIGFFAVESSLAQGPTTTELDKDIEDLIELDPDIAKYLPRWRILEADLKTKLTLFFRGLGYPMRTEDTIIVTSGFDQKTGQEDLLKIEVMSVPGAEINGRASIESRLGESVYNQILEKDRYAHDMLEPETPLTDTEKKRVPSVLNPTNARQFVALSTMRQAVQLGTSGARLEHLIGSDEIGYPFWSGGQGKALVEYPIIRQPSPALRANGVPDILKLSLGVGYRLKFGGPGESALSDIFTPRRLNGAIGAKAIVRAEYRLPQVNDIGIGFYTELPFNKRVRSEAVTGNEEVVWGADTQFANNEFRQPTAVRSAYFLRTVAQGNIFWETWLDSYKHYLRFGIGASYQEVLKGYLKVGDEAYLNPNGTESMTAQGVRLGGPNPPGLSDNVEYHGLDHPNSVVDWIMFRVEYLNQSDFPFGFSAQLANRNLLVSGFVPVVPNWLFLQAQYSTPLLGDIQPWEQKNFIVVSPILRFMLD